jgi:antitoxin HigA-1
MERPIPITPGELLDQEFLQPLCVSQYRLAKAIDVSASRISEIADTDLRLCRFLGLSPGYWLRAQAAHDTEVASAELAEEIERIKPLVAAQP